MMRYTISMVLTVFLGVGFSRGAVLPAGDSSQVPQVNFYDLEEPDAATVGAIKVPMAPREVPASRRAIKIPRRLAESDWEEVVPADSIKHYSKLRDRYTRSASRRDGVGTAFLTIGSALLVTGGILAWHGYQLQQDWNRNCGVNDYNSSTYNCYDQENEADFEVFFASVSLIAGAAFVGSGFGFKSSSASRALSAEFYNKRVNYWKDLERQRPGLSGGPLSRAEWRWLPICDPLRRRAGALLALSL